MISIRAKEIELAQAKHLTMRGFPCALSTEDAVWAVVMRTEHLQRACSMIYFGRPARELSA